MDTKTKWKVDMENKVLKKITGIAIENMFESLFSSESAATSWCCYIIVGAMLPSFFTSPFCC